VNGSRIKSLGGIDLPDKTSLAILESLGFKPGPVTGGRTKVAVPSWRVDIDGEADLVEEVLRIHGYDRIPVLHYEQEEAVPKPTLTPGQRRVSRTRRVLAAASYAECVTYSFMPQDLAGLFGGGDLLLENPISSELDCMRPSILPNLVQAAARNAARGTKAIALFEVGPAYRDETPEGQSHMAAGILLGPKTPRHWKKPSEKPGVLDAKAAAFQVIEAAGFSTENLQTDTAVPAWYHPHRSAVLKLGPKNTIGFFGEIHPRVAKKLGAKGPVAAFEVFLDNLPAPRDKKVKTKAALKISDLPGTERDFAFVVDQTTTAGALIEAVKSADKAHIREVSVFDVFTGKDLPEGKKSLAVSVRLEPRDKTFTEAEIEAISRAIVAAVGQKVSGMLRS